tara:strand:- start:1607 stop:1948 length:342 start_codon:yes stop_codon:yes gene_type:complete
MATTKWNQDINAGQDWFVDFNILNDNNTPRDVTGQTFEALVKRHYKSVGSVPITLIVVNSATGNVTMSLTSAQTSLLKGGKYLYDVEMTRTVDGIKERIIQGVITIRPEITIT